MLASSNWNNTSNTGFSFTATSDVVTADPTTDAPAGWMEVLVGGQAR